MAILARRIHTRIGRAGLQQRINRRATQIKVLYFDRTGPCVWAKRLEQGRLVGNWADVASREMDLRGLKLLLEGIGPKQVRRR
jgi:transposase